MRRQEGLGPNPYKPHAYVVEGCLPLLLGSFLHETHIDDQYELKWRPELTINTVV